jgi:ribosomal-protein-alanine N-acetyltransferase
MHSPILRPWAITDIDNLVLYANNFNISRNLTNKFPYPYTTEDAIKFINFANHKTPTHIFAIEYEAKVIGGIGLHQQEDIFYKNAELGYWLAEPFWGQGIITNAINIVIKIGFEELDINRIFARPFKSNIASQKVLQKTGFILEACLEKTIFKNNVYEDELIYGFRKPIL